MALPKHYNELPMDWVGDYSGRKALMTPTVECILDPHTNVRYNYAQVDDRACRVATFLVDSLGIKKGDRIALVSRNSVESVDLFFACAKIGAILCPLSYRLQKPELKDLLERVLPQAIFIEGMFAELVDTSIMPSSQPVCIDISENSTQYASILATVPRNVKIEIAMNDPFLYVHTGGTTAVPKVCIISHRQMVWNVFEYLMASAGAGSRSELVLFPFFHIGGWNVLFCLFMGNCLAITLRQFDAGMILDLINRKMINQLGAVEAMLQFLSAHPKFAETDFSALDFITTAAAPCSEETMRPYWERNIPSAQAYGLTEAGPANFVFLPRENNMEHIRSHAKKIGTPMFCCDYKIVDPEDRSKKVAVGEIGILCLRSFHNFDGYLNDPVRSLAMMDAEGWIYSGDLAYVDAEGLVALVGRADNMFITGGENVSPEEIEIALRSHPAVSSAICTGVPDVKWGEVPMAMVALNPGCVTSSDDLREHCRQLLAAFKVPKLVAIEAAIPITSMGKLDRKALKKYFEAKAG